MLHVSLCGEPAFWVFVFLGCLGVWVCLFFGGVGGGRGSRSQLVLAKHQNASYFGRGGGWVVGQNLFFYVACKRYVQVIY